jgi:amidase
VQVLPFPVEQEWVTEINGEPQATYIDWMRSCSRITVTLHPAITIPAGLAPAPAAPPSPAPAGLPPAPAPAGPALAIPAPGGLPVGLQLAGRYGDDRRLLEIAAAIMALAAPG